MPAIDSGAPITFLETAFEPEDWIAVLLKCHRTDETTQRVGPRAMVLAPNFQAWVRWRNRQGWSAYVGVNAVAPDQRSRRREAVASVRHVFVDADQEAERTFAAIAGRSDVPPPSYVIHTSPGRAHILWRAAGFSGPLVEAVQQRLANELGADRAATSCAQMTRLPGLWNQKRRPPSLVTIDYRDTSRSYGPCDFPQVAPTRSAESTFTSVRSATRADTVVRARHYLAAVPPAVTGQHGDVITFRACCRLVRGLALTDDQALTALAAWNARCSPPWTERELREKLRRARRYGREPVGGLLDADAQPPRA